jgi:DeoR family fructose operon transcriptional repressor
MNFQKRKVKLLELLDRHDSLEVPDLSEKLGVSPVTIRRDLNLLAEKGLITRTHGGAMSTKASAERVRFSNKAAIRQKQKEYIAELASRYIDDGDIIFLDCGSTVFALAPFLRGKRITVITNSLPLAHALMDSHVKINLVGGEVDQERQATHGSVAADHVRRYKAGKAFIGVDGVSAEGGLSSNGEREAEITAAMIAQSRKVFLLCDSSKLGHDRYLSFAPVSSLHYLITDRDASEELLGLFRKAGVTVIQ